MVRRLLLLGALMALTLTVAAPAAFAQDPGEVDCPDFATQPEAQQFYEANNPSEDPFILDRDNDGKACESLPSGNGGGDNGDGAAPPAEEDDQTGAAANQYDAKDELMDAGGDRPLPDTGGPLLPIAGVALLIGGGLALRRR